MKVLRTFVQIAGLVVVLSGLITPARAAALTGTFDGVATLTPTGTPGIFTQNFTGDGDDATYGSFTPSSTSTVDFSHPPDFVVTNGMISLVFSDGELDGKLGSETGMGNGQGMATFTADLVITGGTGIFANNVGTAMVTGTITTTGPATEAISASYTGSLTTVPEPSTVLLLASGFAGFVWRRRSQTQ
jgi:hypothetical protein